MFGVFFALFCGLALVRLWRRPRFGSPAYALCGGGGRWHGPHTGRGYLAGSWARQVMRDVNATPSQERTIQDTTDEVMVAIRQRQGIWGLGDAVADALTQDRFDRDTLASRLSRDESVTFQGAVIPAIERLHASLDPAQRRTVAARLRGSTCDGK